MNSLSGTVTEKNLLKGFVGESQSGNRYIFFAETARREGFESTANIFGVIVKEEKQYEKQYISIYTEIIG